VFTRAGASGLTYDFEFYTGKLTCPDFQLGISGDIVLHLFRELLANQNFKLYTDNWFTSLPLVIRLKERGIYHAGTLRSDRYPKNNVDPLWKTEKELKESGGGSYDSVVEKKRGIALVRWYDRKLIHLVSTYSGTLPLGTCKRWKPTDNKKVDVNRPSVVEEYNRSMGGVDKMDMLLELYRINIRSRKSYNRIIYWAISVAVVNGWLVYKYNANGQKKMPLIEFHSLIASVLTTAFKMNSSKKKGRPSNEPKASVQTKAKKRLFPSKMPVSDSRYDGIGPFPDVSERKKCRNENCKLLITNKCVKCNVNLCIKKGKNCFIAFHKH